MANEWKVADGHNNTAGLALMQQQPAAPGRVQYPETRYTGAGTSVRHGAAYMDLQWNYISASDYSSLLTQFGLSNATPANEVTVRVRLDDDSYGNRNATAILLSAGERISNQPAVRRGVVIRVAKLEATS